MSEQIIRVTVDLSHCRYIDELHERIRVAFDFPDWYGKNWDACWDLLSEPRDDTVVYVRGIQTLPEELRPSGEKFISLLQCNKEQWDAFNAAHPDHASRFDYEVLD